MRRQFGADEMEEYLRELGRRLRARGVDAEVKVFGGSAIAMLFPGARRLSADIDVDTTATRELAEVIAEMGAELGLPPGWLSSAGAGFLPPRTEFVPEERVYAGLTVRVVSPQTLLAMKLASTRARDAHDLPVLLEACGITEPAQALAVFHDAYPDGVAGGHTPTDEDILLDVAEALQVDPGAS